jgi:hypothetical protein
MVLLKYLFQNVHFLKLGLIPLYWTSQLRLVVTKTNWVMYLEKKIVCQVPQAPQANQVIPAIQALQVKYYK